MEIPKKYDPAQVEDKWYAYWMKNDFFKSEPDDREPYTIVIPPPNVTGVLHMGHMLNNTIQDILTRRARMLGKNALWVPGTDHASIATEAKVVNRLREKGIKKSDIGREEFLGHAFKWKNEFGGVILEQLKKLGASCDWSRTGFTMDPEYSEAVIDTFIDLYKKGKVYRGERMINWDPEALTALSDEEVIHKEVNSKLYYVDYKIEDEDGHLTIATTRPETILGDSGICINPKDERFAHLRGKRAIVPIAGRSIPIIEDEHVDMEFGTGCLKVTPAHDVNDYELGQKHHLETIDIFNPNGTLSEAAGFYIGEDRFDVRKQIVKDLEAAGHINKIEDYVNKVGFSERTDAVIEPRLSLQWWVDMKQLAGPALEHVMNDDIQFHPPKFKNTYRHWMENIKDWCISRQLWWGHRIPAWYYGEGPNDFVVAKNTEEALSLAQEKSGNAALSVDQIYQDEDVVDTWFSSWLWPITLFKGYRSEEELKYYYPTSDLVTAPDIIFFWVARMIMAGYEFVGEKPFQNVYFTGLVRDDQRRKMSKSLGNSPDPLDLIATYGADGVRVGMLFAAPAGNDLLFNEKLCEQGRNFANKIWNAFRLVKGWEVIDGEPTEAASTAIDWFRSRLNLAIEKIDDHYSKFRMSDALMETYKLVWDDLCSWYLEAIKPEYQKPIERATFEATIEYFEEVLKVLHPLMPFISEEIWQFVRERKGKEDALIIAPWPKAGKGDQDLMSSMERAMDVITGIRQVRKSKNIPNKEAVGLQATAGNSDEKTLAFVKKLGNVSSFEQVSEKPTNAFSFLAGTDEYFIPMTGNVDVEEELKKIQTELDYTKGFLNSVDRKLSNEKFVNGAPEAVVASEKKKKSDAEQKIELLEERMNSLTQDA